VSGVHGVSAVACIVVGSKSRSAVQSSAGRAGKARERVNKWWMVAPGANGRGEARDARAIESGKRRW
jgi:hypothetical protein